MADLPWSHMTRGECQVCHIPVDGRSYYCSEHKPARPARTTRKNHEREGAPAEPINVTDLKLNPKEAPKKGPTADTYWTVFGEVLVLVINYVLLKPLDQLPDSEQVQRELMLTSDEVHTLVRPALRIFSQTSVSKSKGATIVEHADVVPAIFVAMTVVERIRTVRSLVEQQTNPNPERNRETFSSHAGPVPVSGFPPGPVRVEDLFPAEGKIADSNRPAGT
jgi:hypothetical protein